MSPRRKRQGPIGRMASSSMKSSVRSCPGFRVLECTRRAMLGVRRILLYFLLLRTNSAYMLLLMALSITRAKTPRKVGVRIPNWTTFARGIYPGLMAYVHEHGPWQIDTTEETTHEIPITTIDQKWRGDGLIVFRCTSNELRAWKRNGIRVVNISSETPSGRIGTPASVIPDNHAAGKLAGNHLLGRGLRQFACWIDPTRRYAQQRYEGFSEVVRRAGYNVETVELAVSKIPIQNKWHSIEAKLRERLPQLDLPIGVFAKDDISAACIIRVCQSIGLNVPRDVAVVGCNNDPAFVYTTTPSLTSVVYPAQKVGEEAAAMLDRMMHDRDWEPNNPTFVPLNQVVERQSTAVFAFEDSLVSHVWAYLQQQSPQRVIQLHDLAQHLAVAEPTLRRRFQRATGHSVKSAIDQTRLSRIKYRLEHTDLPIKRIAYECGFITPEELARFVQRNTGKSPSQWRKERRRSQQR